jgi:hypothetical protein
LIASEWDQADQAEGEAAATDFDMKGSKRVSIPGAVLNREIELAYEQWHQSPSSPNFSVRIEKSDVSEALAEN